MFTLLHTYKTEFMLIALSLMVSSIACWGMYARAQSQGLDFTTLTGDAGGYVLLAENLLNHHVFSFSPTAPFTPDSFRAPGYPLLLSGLYALTHSWFLVLILQMLLVASGPVLLYTLFKPYYPRAAKWAAIVFIFEPIRLFLSSSLLSDAPFMCLLLLSLILLDRGRARVSLTMIAASGIVLSICILMRPIAMFLPLLYVGFLAYTQRPLMRSIQAASVLVLAVGLFVLPWSIRNAQIFGSWQLSSVGNANLVIYNAPAYLAYHPDPRGQEILDSFAKDQAQLPPLEALSLAHASDFTGTFRKIIRGHEWSYIFFHVVKTAPFFLTDGLRDTVRLFNVDIGVMPNISTALLRGDFSLLASYVLHGGLPILLLLVGVGFWGVVTLLFLLALIGVVRKRKTEPVIVLCVALVFYFALLTGPVSSARYRLPVEGFLLMVAASMIIRQRATPHESSAI